jgi:hypothetical protein
MRYTPLLSVQVHHEFFDGACPDLRIDPTPECARALACRRLLARPRPDGLEIVGPVVADGAPLIAYGALHLLFHVRLTGPDFLRYTDWPAAPRFHPSASGELVQVEPPEDSRPLPHDVAADLAISTVDADWLVTPPRLRLTLAAKRPYWVFYAVTAAKDAAPPQIVDKEPNRGMTFTCTPLLVDSAAAAADPVGQRIAARHPGHAAFRLVSDAPVPARNAPRKLLQLCRGDDPLVEHLPNPSLHNPLTLRVENNAEPRESLFRVIEY